MTSPDGRIDLLARALHQAEGLIAKVRPEQASLPSPCASWDVRALVNHIVDEVHAFSIATNGGRRYNQEEDVIGDDWAGAFRANADELLAAWRTPGTLERPQRLSIGEVSPVWAIEQQITELVIHGWDVAKATGQSTDLDPELGELAFRWGHENLRPEFRGDESDGYQIGHEVAVPEDAPLYDRLAAFGGRDPR